MSNYFNLEGNINDFCEYLYNIPPKNKKSITIDFESISSNNRIFDILLVIYLKGLSKFCNNSDNIIDELFDPNYQLIIKYFNSFGINANLYKYNINDNLYNNNILSKIHNKNPTKLEDFYDKIIIKDIIYIIYFSYLI